MIPGPESSGKGGAMACEIDRIESDIRLKVGVGIFNGDLFDYVRVDV